MSEIPEQAISAAVEAVMERRNLTSDGSRQWARPIITAALEAATLIIRDDERQRILAGAEALKTSLWRPGYGSAYSEAVDVVLWDKLDELLREQP